MNNSRSRKISGTKSGAGQLPSVGPGKAAAGKIGMHPNFVHGPKSKAMTPKAGMGGGKKGYC